MTERAIQVGDLVQITKSLCGNEGKIGTVVAFAGLVDTYTESHGQRWWVLFPRPIPDTWGELQNPAPIPHAWLKRIPPLSELEGQRTQEDLREPA